MGTDRQGRRSPLRRRPLISFAGGPGPRLRRLALAVGLPLGGALWLLVPPGAPRADPDREAPPPGDAVAVVRGAVHVHSTWSDGSGTPDEIAAAAGRAGLDFVVLTDHGDGTRPPEPAAYRSGVLRLDAVEISTDGGHYLALGLPQAPYPLGGDAAGVVADVARLGGLGIVAHPASPKPELAWRDWSLPVDGVEWLNADSQWRDEGPASLAAAVAGYVFRAPESLATILDRPVAALAHWDRLAAGRRVVGLAGTDAHASLPTGIGAGRDDGGVDLHFPSYETLFRALSLHVELPRPWSGDPQADAEMLLDALRGGRSYTAIDALGELAHFRYRGRSGGVDVEMGERVTGVEPVALEVRAGGPPGREIVLLRNGLDVARSRDAAFRFVVPAGLPPAAYRVEVRLDDAPGTPRMPWIVSNPIYVGAEATPAPEGPPALLTVAELTASAGWRAEASADSEASVEQGDAELRLRFRLGPGAGRFAAAAYDLDAGSLRAGVGLAFEAVATSSLRASVQLRGTGGRADRRWRASFHAGVTPEPVRVRLDELAPVGPASGSPPAAGDYSLLVVVDSVNTAAGAAGVLALRVPRLVAEAAR